MKKDTTPLFKIDWSKPQQSIVRITPDDALRILENHNNGNRLLRHGGAKYIAEQITKGEWVENHPQPICFTEDGLLLDGQHRINGILLANVSVWASCHFGVNPKYMQYMDTGISRSLGDRVTFVAHREMNKFISGLVTLRHSMTKGGKPTPATAMELFYEKEKAYIAVAEKHQAKRYVSTVNVGIAFVDYYERYGKEALEMYSELFKMTTDCQPAQALKSFLATTIMRGTTTYPYIVSACMAHHEGRKVKQIKAATWR
jgi:hypothetical protein